MKQELLELLKDLADVLEKHQGGLTYTTSDDGIHVTQGEEWQGVCIEWPMNGNVETLRKIISANNSKLTHDMNDENKQDQPDDSSVNSVGFSELLCCEDCGKQDDTVMHDTCPYAEEINDSHIPIVICPDCYHERCMDI